MNDNQPNDSQNKVDIPSPEEMLRRLKDVDVQQFNIKTVASELKGNKIWVSVLTIPVSAIILVLITLLGSFMFDQPILSFIVAAALLFWVSKMFEGQERNYKIAARHEIMQRIKQTEGEFGLIPHFKHFLPSNIVTFGSLLKKANINILNSMFKPFYYYKIN